MSYLNSQQAQKLNAYYKPEGFIVDLEIANSAKINEEMAFNDEIEEWKKQFNENKYLALLHLGFITKKEWFSPALEYLYSIADKVLQKLSRQPDIELSRELVRVELSEEECIDLIDKVPFAIGMEYVDSSWLHMISDRLIGVFRVEISEYSGPVSMYFTEHNSNINVVGRVFFHMVENSETDYPFAFMATYSSKPVKSKKAVHTPLKNALQEYKQDEKKLLSLLSTVTKAADHSNFISDLMESGELFSPIKLTVQEAYTFLSEIPLYEEAGIMCRVPDWWRKKSNSVRLSVTVGNNEPSKVGLDAIMDFTPTLLIGEEKLSEKELKQFLSMAEGLVQYKGKWIEINKDKLSQALEAFHKVKDRLNDDEITLREALRMELQSDSLANVSIGDIETIVTNGQWLNQIRSTLNNPLTVEQIEEVPSFHATLRRYQKSGYHWLYQMSKLGFGACLADDMGLGKTVQMIAFLEHYRTHFNGNVLLILPASLIGNWQKEIEKFAPEMTYQILHNSAGKTSEKLCLDDTVFLSVTTYGMAVRLEALQKKQWDILILDEAQAIKNPGTKQTKQIKKLSANMRIAMTGTPIENRLIDLWSLFDFLNQGLLGSAKEFSDFTKGLTDNGTGYAKLRKMIQPFILRRLKTDKSIITDLPDKLEINEYTALSTKQIALYQKLVRQIEIKLQDAEGIERKGLVLSSIMKFKQICNHPDQYLGREEYIPESSGKFEQLRDICDTIYEKKEKVLIFTQFREMTEPLSDYLKQIFHKEGFVLHGGTPVKTRSQMVERFNSEEYIPYMVLSLKAGGVGLNLTAANHVIHFDRWWNPAVENQATDRAFRIGQTKNVMVHKFITKGTIEEKIDAMIMEKQKLAGDILSTNGEQWITELNNNDLMKLFALGGDML
ncbi:MAG: helicase, superfamily [Herbinix sp.]|nr:helicase, superfamily [Herbinix sp.]